jgi:hypothetical protein
MSKPTNDEAKLLELMRADRLVHVSRRAREELRDRADDITGKATAARVKWARERRAAKAGP